MDLDIGMGHSGTGTANELHVASRRGDLEEVKRLIEKERSTPDKYGRDTLPYVALGGELRVMKYFIEERGCNPSCQNSRGGTMIELQASSIAIYISNIGGVQNQGCPMIDDLL